MKYVMAQRQDVNDQGRPGPLPTQLSQTTEEIARAAVAAAAAVRPRPSIVVKEHNDNNFNRWRRQLQKALHWGPSTRERERRNVFNPEVLTRQKRQWSDLQLRALEKKQPKQERPSFFEHFVVVGLHPSTNVEAAEVAFARKKAWQRHPERAEWLGNDAVKNRKGLTTPTLEPQVLFKYPPGKRLPLKTKDLPAFCFPSGVEARLMERTPSMSELNEIMYGQSHQKRDDQSFIFLLKVADNVTLYGVCVLVPEIVQRLPGILAMNTAVSPPQSPPSRFLVSAPRCYCFLTRLPFFNLHFEVLNSIIAQERLDRITQCVNEMSLAEHMLPTVKVVSRGDGHVQREDYPDGWMDSAIPVESVIGATAAAAGLISDKEALSFSSKGSDPPSPIGNPEGLPPTPVAESVQDVADGNGVVAGKEDQAETHLFDKSTAIEHSEEQTKEPRLQVDDFQTPTVQPKITVNGNHAASNGIANGVVPGLLPGPSERQRVAGHERMESSDSVYSVFESSVRSNESDDDVGDEEATPLTEADGSRAVLAWAEANNNDSLRIICAYDQTPVPGRGSSILFQPLEHLQPLQFSRRKDFPLSMMGARILDIHACRTSLEVAEVQAAVMAGEEAMAISIWATATLCRALSLENVMNVFTGALLEKQMVVICPNLGVLSAIVMALVPMIRPYEWQSLLLPILPNKMLDFLEAPVPFIVGVQHKTPEVRSRSAGLMRVNVYKDKVTSPSMPQVPRYKELVSTLEPHYAKLSAENNVAKKHPIFEYSDAQAAAADGFLAVLRNYLESLCMDLRAHTITNVQSNDDKVDMAFASVWCGKLLLSAHEHILAAWNCIGLNYVVSLLLKESFVDSFGHRDRPFMKLFADTQQFSVYTDAVLSSYQHS